MAKLVSANLINNAKLCILYYNTTDSKKLFDEEWSNLFDADIISHTYDKVGTVIFDKQITRICDKAFSDVTNLKSIWIPSGVISIGERTFKGCSNLTSITIPNSITEIGRNAFEECENIRGVYISDLSSWCRIKFSDMQANPLYYAKKLYLDGNLITELIIPSEVTDIAYYAFCSCCSLTSVTIPDSVTKIRGKAFYECSKLTSITIPDSVTYIGDYAFKGCSELTSIANH